MGVCDWGGVDFYERSGGFTFIRFREDLLTSRYFCDPKSGGRVRVG